MNNAENQFKADVVCKILIKKKLLAANRAKEILRHKTGLLKKLESIRDKRYKDTPAEEIIHNPLNIIDVINSLNLNRLDNQTLPLDEETIYQTLAQDWEVHSINLIR